LSPKRLVDRRRSIVDLDFAVFVHLDLVDLDAI
jgi:hypothetical protein